MKIFAIGDLHLALNVDKPMDIFGDHWKEHAEKIRSTWIELVGSEDIVLIPGDISWALKFEDAMKDLDFVGSLTGKKILIKGNHDLWWSSLKKVRDYIHPSIIPLYNTSWNDGRVGVAGTRLWLDPELKLEETKPEDKKIFEREISRLQASLATLPQNIEHKIIMTHFPPISPDGKEGGVSQLAKKSGCGVWIFGHMHLSGDIDFSGFNRTINGVRYELASADWLDFTPKMILELT